MDANSRWLVRTKLSTQDELRLFCFPYAGGSAAAYLRWAGRLPAQVVVCPVELPGRGKRFGEPCLRDLSVLVKQAAVGLLPYLDRPFAFFGHSMGALISFELARTLTWDYRLPPTQLFLSAHRAPHLPRTTAVRYTLPDQGLIRILRDLGGATPELLQQPELLQLVLPIVRADFELCDTYVYQPGAPLSCPITVLGGQDDPLVCRQQLVAWQRQTSATFLLQMFDGDHFYLNNAQSAVLTMLAQQVQVQNYRLPLGDQRSYREQLDLMCA